MNTPLTPPDPIAQHISDQLFTLITQRIRDAGGQISFADYMQLCLYAPGLGYYSAGSHKLGKQGDFSTAPEISPLFSRTLARHILTFFPLLERADILEFGAGSGKMAADILLELQANSALPDHYYIIEASADLRERQYHTINQALSDWSENVIWLDRLPDEFSGVILANEVCDAMPVHCLHFQPGQIRERFVTLNEQHELAWCENQLSSRELAAAAQQLHPLIGQTDMLTEINLAAKAWLTAVAAMLKQGICLIMDYGYPRSEYYHPQRTHGTLMCYYRHQGHDNPLILPGIQDISAHVDFTQLAQTALDAGLQVEGFQSQADFLLVGGITELMIQQSSARQQLQQAAEIKRLTHPALMGETFKVLTLSRQVDAILTHCQRGDRRYML